MSIKCCYGCVIDRSPTCHGTCEKYLKEKAAHEAEKAEERKRKMIADGIYSQRSEAVAKRYRRNGT